MHLKVYSKEQSVPNQHEAICPLLSPFPSTPALPCHALPTSPQPALHSSLRDRTYSWGLSLLTHRIIYLILHHSLPLYVFFEALTKIFVLSPPPFPPLGMRIKFLQFLLICILLPNSGHTHLNITRLRHIPPSYESHVHISHGNGNLVGPMHVVLSCHSVSMLSPSIQRYRRSHRICSPQLDQGNLGRDPLYALGKGSLGA